MKGSPHHRWQDPETWPPAILSPVDLHSVLGNVVCGQTVVG